MNQRAKILLAVVLAILAIGVAVFVLIRGDLFTQLRTSTPVEPGGGNTETKTFTWTPAADQEGEHVFTITATDSDGATTTETITVTVDPDAPPPPGCPGDLNGDTVINIQDISILVANWGKDSSAPDWDPRADTNGDNVTNITDLTTVVGGFGTSCND